MSAGTRFNPITATAPASSAIFAWSAVTTSMITPPLSISAMPRLTRAVPVSGPIVGSSDTVNLLTAVSGGDASMVRPRRRRTDPSPPRCGSGQSWVVKIVVQDRPAPLPVPCCTTIFTTPIRSRPLSPEAARHLVVELDGLRPGRAAGQAQPADQDLAAQPARGADRVVVEAPGMTDPPARGAQLVERCPRPGHRS